MGDSWHSYPKIYALGHAAVRDIFSSGNVVVQEKIDGSQFSFGVFDGRLRIRSKGKEQDVDVPDKMFDKALVTVRDILPLLSDGVTYRAEYLRVPKHNALAYERVPRGNLIIFDINTGHEEYLSPKEVAFEANRIGLEVVPTFTVTEVRPTMEWLDQILSTVSCLGGPTIEGVVLKNYSLFGQDKKSLMAKFVSESFKEKHEKVWGAKNVGNKDLASRVIDAYKTEARWEKAWQHLRDSGQLEESLRDIPKLLQEVSRDTLAECEGEIKDILFKQFWKPISSGIIRGLPEWYKRKLAESQFAETDAPVAQEQE